jgi:hypothetical protein
LLHRTPPQSFLFRMTGAACPDRAGEPIHPAVPRFASRR